MPYIPGKRAISNLSKLVRSFNSQAAKVNKLYSSTYDNYTPVPKQSVDKILSRVHSYKDLRRERARLNRFFKKNKKHAQDIVYDPKTKKYVTKWFKDEYENMLKEEKRRRKKAEETAKETGRELPSYPQPSAPPESDRAFEGLADRLADMMLPNVAQLYIEELENNGYLVYEEGKQTVEIIKLIYKVFPDYLETLFYTGDERSTIEYLYIGHDDYMSGNAFRKVSEVYNYWKQAAQDISI